MGLTVKDFAKTLKIKDDALLERMKAAGLSHSKASDEITPADKLAILKSLKERNDLLILDFYGEPIGEPSQTCTSIIFKRPNINFNQN